jgi:hypothetical protein
MIDRSPTNLTIEQAIERLAELHESGLDTSEIYKKLKDAVHNAQHFRLMLGCWDEVTINEVKYLMPRVDEMFTHCPLSGNELTFH